MSRGSGPPPGKPPFPEADLPWLWRAVETFFRRLYRVEPVTAEPDCLLAFNRARYRGPERRLACGALLRPGDLLLELHFRREALRPLTQQGDPARIGLGLLRLADRDLPRLARRLETEPALAGVAALHAVTLFHRGIRRYGFETAPLEPRLAEWWFSAWQRRLLARDHPLGRARIATAREALVARHVWISRAALLGRYGGGGAVAASAPASRGPGAPGAAEGPPPFAEKGGSTSTRCGSSGTS